MTEKHFMTEKVFLADIKNRHKTAVSLCASVSSVVKTFVADYGGFCRGMWQWMSSILRREW